MKKTLHLVLMLWLLPAFMWAQAPVSQVSEKTPAGKITTSDFEGQWAGEEKCQNISAPLSKIIITPQGDAEVLIAGLYSSVGPVIGSFKGNVITIPKQIVPDPVFKNLKIQGNLTLSKNRKSLQGNFIILNNDARDDCSTTYHR